MDERIERVGRGALSTKILVRKRSRQGGKYIGREAGKGPITYTQKG